MFKRFWGIIRMQIAVTFAYRGTIFFWIFLHIMNFAVMFFFWTAVFSDQSTVQGFTLEQMLQYVLITSIIREFVMVAPEYQVNSEINQGKLSTYLLRPLSYPFYVLMSSSIWHLLQMSIGLLMYVIIAYFFLPNLHFSISWLTLMQILPLIFLGHIFCNLLSITLGYMAFWLQQASAFFYYKDLVILLTSGLFFPKALLPEWFQSIMSILPFYSFIGLPAELLTDRINNVSLFPYIVQLLIWIAVMLAFQTFVWRRGVKTYEAVGG